MTIAYELRDEDAVETGVFRLYGLPETKKALRTSRLLLLSIAPFFLLLQFALWRLGVHGPPFLLFMLMPCLMALFLTPFSQRATLKGQVQNKKQAHLFQADKGRRTVTARPDGLLVSAEGVSDTLIHWDAIEAVTAEKNHIFIRWAGTQIVTIPRRAFAGLAQESAFLEEVARYRMTLPPLPAILSTLPEALVSETVTPAVPIPAVTVAPAPPVTPANNTPWWQGQTVSSIDNEAKANINRRNGG